MQKAISTFDQILKPSNKNLSPARPALLQPSQPSNLSGIGSVFSSQQKIIASEKDDQASDGSGNGIDLPDCNSNPPSEECSSLASTDTSDDGTTKTDARLNKSMKLLRMTSQPDSEPDQGPSDGHGSGSRSQGTQDRAGESRSTPSAGGSGRGGKSGSVPHNYEGGGHGPGENEEEDQGGQGERPTKSVDGSTSGTEPERLACCYFKRYPETYLNLGGFKSCSGPGFKNCSRLK